MDPPVITLTTDFGTRDAYVGIMKGVILGICPRARLVDLSHEVAPQDVVEAALVLADAAPFFPAGTVHLAVVDPGVGTRRRAVALGLAGAFFVGPGNGVFGPVWERARSAHSAGSVRAVELTESRFFLPAVDATFHGRDVFAPVAAHLARGVGLDELGPRVEDPGTLSLPAPVRLDGKTLEGEVIHVDRFGNCTTNVARADLEQLGAAGSLRVEAAGRGFGPVRTTYGEVAPGEVLALVGSSGRLELALREGHLARTADLTPGSRVQITVKEHGA